MAADANRGDRPTAEKIAVTTTSMETKRLRLEYFAGFREERGVSAEVIETGSRTAAELYDELDAKHHFRSRPATTRVAVNEALVPWHTELRDGDTVVFLAPFGGG